MADAKAPAWTFTPNLSGNYSVYLKVKDGIGIIVKSNEASVTVAPHLGALILPKSAAILVGESITFISVVWGGFLPRSCQWYINDAPVSGATSSKWIFTPTESGDFNISLKVADNLGFTEQSNIASMTVRAQIVVSVLPTSVSAHVNQTIEFTSNASGGYPSYNYQWYLNNEPVTGATSSKWAFRPAKSGNFSVSLKVVDSVGFTADSNAVVAEITILGDLNRDRKVDMRDLAIASRAFGSSLGYSAYNRDSDVNEDGRVDIKDLVLIAKNFGKADL